MSSYQKIIICGNLGRDPDMRHLPSGDAVASFSIAVSERWRDKSSGETKEQTTWFRCGAFGKTAEIVEKFCKKGSSVLVDGRMVARQYEKDGVKRESWEVRVDSLKLMGGKPRDGDQAPSPDEQPQKAKAPGGSGFEDMDDDIPF
jgi:single-strand DNA-binding protein